MLLKALQGAPNIVGTQVSKDYSRFTSAKPRVTYKILQTPLWETLGACLPDKLFKINVNFPWQEWIKSIRANRNWGPRIFSFQSPHADTVKTEIHASSTVNGDPAPRSPHFPITSGRGIPFHSSQPSVKGPALALTIRPILVAEVDRCRFGPK
jgi:hypothetical protein